jgi:hypothetical protein
VRSILVPYFSPQHEYQEITHKYGQETNPCGGVNIERIRVNARRRRELLGMPSGVCEKTETQDRHFLGKWQAETRREQHRENQRIDHDRLVSVLAQ